MSRFVTYTLLAALTALTVSQALIGPAAAKCNGNNVNCSYGGSGKAHGHRHGGGHHHHNKDQ